MSEAESRWKLYIDDQTKRGTDSAKRNVTGVESAVTQLNQRFGLGIPIWAGWAAAAAGAGVVLNRLTGFITTSIQAAAAEEQTFRRLQTSVELLGRDYAALASDNRSWFTAIQRTTEFADDQAAMAMTTLVQVTSDYEKATRALPLALDMASSGLWDLSTAARYAGMAQQGEFTMLARYVPELRRLKAELGPHATAAERGSRAMEILNSKFSGTAIRNVESYTGAVTRLRNATGDIKESLGAIGMAEMKVHVRTLTIIAESGWVEGLLAGLFKGGSMVPGPGEAKRRTAAEGSGYVSRGGFWDALAWLGGSRSYRDYLKMQDIAAPGSPGFIGPPMPPLGLPAGSGMTLAEWQERQRQKRLSQTYGSALMRMEPGWDADILKNLGTATGAAGKGLSPSGMAEMAKIPEVPFGEDTAEKIWDLLDPLTKLRIELEQQGLAWTTWGGAVDQMVAGAATSLGHLGGAYMQLFEGQKKAFPAAMQMIAQELAARVKAIGTQAAIKALESGAWALYYLAQGNIPAASFMAKAAGGFALTATAAGAAAGAISKNAGGGEYGSASWSSSEGTQGRAAVVSGEYGGTTSVDAAKLAPTTINVSHIYYGPVSFGSQAESDAAAIQALLDTGAIYTEREVQ